MTHKQLIERIESYRELGYCWDGYHAHPLPEKVIKRALSLVPMFDTTCEVFPTGRKSTQFEYETEGYYVELEIYENEIEMYSIDKITKKEVE